MVLSDSPSQCTPKSETVFHKKNLLAPDDHLLKLRTYITYEASKQSGELKFYVLGGKLTKGIQTNSKFDDFYFNRHHNLI